MRGHDIFVSYSREDRSAAERISARLEDEGFSVWWDAAIHSGETFDEIIERELRAAKAAIVLWSPRSVASRWVRAEATLADRRNILVPVLIETCELPIIFELTHTIDLSSWDGEPKAPLWQRLIGDIRRLVDAGASNFANAGPPKGFLLADDPPMERNMPERAAPAGLASLAQEESEAILAKARVPDRQPAASADTEQTAFYVRNDDARQLHGKDVHCLEAGPEDAPVVRYPVGLLGAKLGRAAPADIILADKRISRRHCDIAIEGGELVVTDLHSTNGTFIDGERIDRPTVLPSGSELRLGDVVLVHRIRTIDDLD